MERDGLRRLRTALKEPDSHLERLRNLTELLMHSTLRKGGYHLHQRGAWRKRRKGNNTMGKQTHTEKVSQLTPEQIQAILDRAQQGDRTVLPELEQVLDQYPAIWQKTGDLAAQVLAAWVKLLAGSDLVLEESLRRTLLELRIELEGDAPSPLEKVLVQRVLACWLQAAQADAATAQT
jgi:hypothetical protein